MTATAIRPERLAVRVPPSLGRDLEAHAREALDRANRRRRRVVASASTPLPADLDVGMTVLASRHGFSRSFCWEQPDRCMGGLGSLVDVTPSGGGPDRFGVVAQRVAHVLQDAAFDEPSALGPSCGPVFVGGFSFSPDGCSDPAWRWLPSGLMSLPAVGLRREDGVTLLTVNVLVSRGDDPVALARRRMSDLGMLEARAAPVGEPTGAGVLATSDSASAASFVRGVDAARRIIASGPLKKVVLGRTAIVSSSAAIDPEAVYGRLRRAFSDCYCFAVTDGDACFLGASPELLVRRAGSTVSTVAMAGSTPRGVTPAEDDRLARRLLASEKDRAEHTLVVTGIERALDRVALWVTRPHEPGIAKIANIQHLATPIHAQLEDPLPAVKLAGLLHPTPAVGGDPWDLAAGAISRLESFDRGWYAGPIGWMDSSEDGEFCVALRSALISGRTATCYAGAGIVADSTPEGELAETLVKLQAMLGALSA